MGKRAGLDARQVCALGLVAIVVACSGGDDTTKNGAGADGGGSGDAGSAPASIASKARAITEKLGGAHADHFLIGLGSDDGAAYTLGPPLDVHYDYLVGLSTMGGWPTWNSSPDYLGVRVNDAKSHGMIFLATYYCMAAAGDGNVAGSIQDATYMTTYWKDYAELLSSIHAAGEPVLVHMEPDYWGYLEKMSLSSGGAANVSAQVAVSNATECKGEPDNVVGFTHCILAMARSRAPEAIMGLHASIWGSNMDVGENTDPSFDVAGEAQKTVDFFKSIGGDKADFIATDMLDRDAGCYEVGYTDDKGNKVCPNDPGTKRYWDESNASLPNFHQEQAWISAVGKGLDLPVAWWQIPLGVPADSPGGSAGHFRDNRVHYMFQHIDEYVAAGGFLAAFGTGAGGQTAVGSDGDQLKNAAAAYYAKPVSLP